MNTSVPNSTSRLTKLKNKLSTHHHQSSTASSTSSHNLLPRSSSRHLKSLSSVSGSAHGAPDTELNDDIHFEDNVLNSPSQQRSSDSDNDYAAPHHVDDFVFLDPPLSFDTSANPELGINYQAAASASSIDLCLNDNIPYAATSIYTKANKSRNSGVSSISSGSSGSAALFENKPSLFTKLKVYSDDDDDDGDFDSDGSSQSQRLRGPDITIGDASKTVKNRDHKRDTLTISPHKNHYRTDYSADGTPKVSRGSATGANSSPHSPIPTGNHFLSANDNIPQAHKMNSKASNLTLKLTRSHGSSIDSANAHAIKSVYNSNRLRIAGSFTGNNSISPGTYASNPFNDFHSDPSTSSKHSSSSSPNPSPSHFLYDSNGGNNYEDRHISQFLQNGLSEISSLHSENNNHINRDANRTGSRHEISSIKTSSSSLALNSDPLLCAVTEIQNQISAKEFMSTNQYQLLISSCKADSEQHFPEGEFQLVAADYKDYKDAATFTRLVLPKELAFFNENHLPSERIFYPKYFLFKILNSRKRCLVFDKSQLESGDHELKNFKLYGDFLSSKVFLPKNIWKLSLLSIKNCKIKENILSELINFLNGFWDKLYYDKFENIDFKQTNASLLYYKKLLSAFNVYDDSYSTVFSSSELSVFKTMLNDSSLNHNEDEKENEQHMSMNKSPSIDSLYYYSQMSHHVKNSIHSQKLNGSFQTLKTNGTSSDLSTTDSFNINHPANISTKASSLLISSAANSRKSNINNNDGRHRHKRFSSFHFYKRKLKTSKSKLDLSNNSSGRSVDESGVSDSMATSVDNVENGSYNKTDFKFNSYTGKSVSRSQSQANITAPEIPNSESKGSIVNNSITDSSALPSNSVLSPDSSVISFNTEEDLAINNEDKKSYLNVLTLLFEVVCKLTNFAMFLKSGNGKKSGAASNNDASEKYNLIEKLLNFLSKYVIKFILIDVVNLTNDYMRFSSEFLKTGAANVFSIAGIDTVLPLYLSANNIANTST